MSARVQNIQKTLRSLADRKTALELQRFFKTKKGEYGESDRFLGIRVPKLRSYLNACKDISIFEISTLLKSAFHEERMFSLLMLVSRFLKGDDKEKKSVYETYLKHTEYINSWDLVDCSAHQIVGAYLMMRDKQPIYDLAVSDVLWERRIAMVSTFYFIKHHEFEDALAIAKMLKTDTEDLIHKAVGWMLREIGKRDLLSEEKFLKLHYKTMPRTMLRYAIEKFEEEKRQAYLKGNI
jgi:3-methyladenine DNA glycosylase AlkD